MHASNRRCTQRAAAPRIRVTIFENKVRYRSIYENYARYENEKRHRKRQCLKLTNRNSELPRESCIGDPCHQCYAQDLVRSSEASTPFDTFEAKWRSPRSSREAVDSTISVRTAFSRTAQSTEPRGCVFQQRGDSDKATRTGPIDGMPCYSRMRTCCIWCPSIPQRFTKTRRGGLSAGDRHVRAGREVAGPGDA